MPDGKQPRSSAEPITAVIAERVRALREAAKLSQSDLAILMNNLGVPWKRSTVVNLEKRSSSSRGADSAGRDSVTVQELLALAQVLHIPPVMLISDPRHGEHPPVGHPGQPDAWSVLLWLIGWRHLDPLPPTTSWEDASKLVKLAAIAADMISDLDRPLSYVRGPDGKPRPDPARDQIDTDAVRYLASALAEANALGASDLPIPEFVTDRAKALGMKLPGTGS